MVQDSQHIPSDILTQLKRHCDERGWGMGSAWSQEFGIVLMGNKEHGANHIALLCVQALVEGILNGFWDKMNAVTEILESEGKPH